MIDVNAEKMTMLWLRINKKEMLKETYKNWPFEFAGACCCWNFLSIIFSGMKRRGKANEHQQVHWRDKPWLKCHKATSMKCFFSIWESWKFMDIFIYKQFYKPTFYLHLASSIFFALMHIIKCFRLWGETVGGSEKYSVISYDRNGFVQKIKI